MSGRLFVSIALVGIVVRAIFFIVSPPSNSYDDHLEAVAFHTSEDGSYVRAPPDACWQCYQPPLYYVIANAVVGLASPGTSDGTVWKRVQAISFVASSLSLVLCTLSLWMLSEGRIRRSVGLFLALLAALLPRLIFTSAMPTNDALLEMTVSMAALGYVLACSDFRWAKYGFMFILSGTLLAAFTKQSGLVMTVPLMILIVARLVFKYNPARISVAGAVLGLLVVLACFTDEYWRYMKTGLVLASNQDFFDYAVGQSPGNIAAVKFFSLDLFGLLKNPFLSSDTLASFWTEIYGRLWFDYERRFFDLSNVSFFFGRVIYVLSMPIMAFLLASLMGFRGISKRPFLPLILLVACAGFLAVPIVQTIRFPYYSSMKAVFLTAAITPMLCAISFGASEIARKANKYRVLPILGVCVGLIGLSSLFLLLATSSQAWSSGVSGPLWPLPRVGG